MPTAHEVATELRKLADSLDRSPETIITKPSIYFYCNTKDEFIASASFVPRPFAKYESGSDDRWRRIRIKHVTPALEVDASVEKALTCELIEPAKPAVYRCVPILSLEEEAVVL